MTLLGERGRVSVKYAAFAVLAIVANILSQEMVSREVSGVFYPYFGVFVGTLVGLVTKYWLDKKYIFFYRSEKPEHDLKIFFLYASTGVATTLIFWGAELGGELVFGSKTAKYAGAAVGLCIGYFAKYRLDKIYVFRVL